MIQKAKLQPRSRLTVVMAVGWVSISRVHPRLWQLSTNSQQPRLSRLTLKQARKRECRCLSGLRRKFFLQRLSGLGWSNRLPFFVALSPPSRSTSCSSLKDSSRAFRFSWITALTLSDWKFAYEAVCKFLTSITFLLNYSEPSMQSASVLGFVFIQSFLFGFCSCFFERGYAHRRVSEGKERGQGGRVG